MVACTLSSITTFPLPSFHGNRIAWHFVALVPGRIRCSKKRNTSLVLRRTTADFFLSYLLLFFLSQPVCRSQIGERTVCTSMAPWLVPRLACLLPGSGAGHLRDHFRFF